MSDYEAAITKVLAIAKALVEIALYRHEAIYQNAIETIAQDVFENIVIPFCDRRGWNFFSGNGSYWAGPPDNEVEYFYLHPSDDPELASVQEILDIDILDGQPLGSYMDNFYYSKKKAPKTE